LRSIPTRAGLRVGQGDEMNAREAQMLKMLKEVTLALRWVNKVYQLNRDDVLERAGAMIEKLEKKYYEDARIPRP